ncbi:SGNH/GDSL hydrolase family protein [Paraburkholderia sp. Tr-20389]|uniref:SGNH/GDSL hydrolase family protein n=1 Tax=Paraburkholderia sp. Tr-20389 TaxID=2703903 RepID=UPI00197E88B7|nr:SGNH/GDSL hydrolase family protein [Paraburkholderia sp. Tr-20389]MBN3758948.1 SGNH/GDSL hydrolase family protein [Paraburkholderia sp. Tr-20389]
MSTRSLAVACGAVLSTVLLVSNPVFAADNASPWVTAWATALQPIPEIPNPPSLYRAPEVAGRTVRQILYPTLSGEVVRLHISNAYGKTPLVIEDLRIARAGGGAGAAVQGGTAMRVTFGGKPAVSVPPGGEIDSDPVRAGISAGAPYVISSYMGREQKMVAWHRVSSQVNYLSTPGNHTEDVSADAYRQRFTQFAWLTGLQVEAPTASTIAAIGDSITDGMRSSLNQNRRWPDALARRVALSGDKSAAVVNLGISGNRLLSDSPCYGDALVTRFGRDVLAPPGVKTVILMIGINDINFAAMPPHGGLDCDSPHTQVTADGLIAGYKRVIAAARAKGLRIFGATLTPAALPPQREAIRAEVNQWIRTGRSFDGVVDFDAALRDPAEPTRLKRVFDSGDQIHPSDAGYAAMADAIPLQAVIGAARK